MKKIYSMTLHANESVMKEEAKGISQRVHKNLSFRFLLITVLVSITMGNFFVACNSEDTYNDRDSELGFETYLSLSKTNFDFARDWENLSENDKNTFRIAKKRMNLTFGKDGIYHTKWTSGSQVNISEELFDCFIDMIALTNEATNIVYPSQNIFPRLKSGNERWECCVVQTLVYVLQNFYAPNESYGIGAIDNWINTHNYYTYDNGMWGAYAPNVLTHYLEGGYINKNAILSANANGSSQYIIVLNGPPAHMVVFTGRNSSGTIYYYDPQNGSSGQCVIGDINDVYKATGFC